MNKFVRSAEKMLLSCYRHSENNFVALSVGDILQYYLLPAALRNEFSESLCHIKETEKNYTFPIRDVRKF